ncbi:MAG: UDP-N-acetylmuramoyl-tripeptide--D-alanyl-D-alanine ligase [Synergistaceae bacterium]|nr:UDP-N-acetylmuramoyl-tripeptide--D-alanyl-D-alanine ligase [Synergistaceae bacterium]
MTLFDLGLLLSVALFIVCWALAALRNYHIFQLNSYKPLSQLRWLRRNLAGEYLLRYAYFAAVPVISLFTEDPALAAYVFTALCALHAIANRPRKAKKPLVFTNRLKRMFATDAALTAAALAGAFHFGSPYPALSLWLMAAPLVTLLTNAINAPVEKRINDRYIEDARRIIKNMPRLTVIGVTGSYGKTSTKYFLHRVLSSKFNVLMTPESYNTTMGVVKTIRNDLRPFHEVFVCEMGARNAGDIKEICDIVSPRLGVITSIGPQHLESFGTMQNIVRTKFELADALPDDGALFANGDNAHIRGEIARRGGCRAVSYGMSECDYIAKDISVSSAGSAFTVAFPDRPGKSARLAKEFSTKLLGRHNVTNILAALAVADYLGVDADAAAVSVRRLEAVPHRLQLISRGGMIIIDDAYNSNESGSSAALEVLGGFDGFKILVTPGMVELGEEQDRLNRKFGQMAASVCDFVILVGERVTGSILAGLKSASYPDEKIFIARDVVSAFERAAAIRANKQKVVLVENDLPDNY